MQGREYLVCSEDVPCTCADETDRFPLRGLSLLDGLTDCDDFFAATDNLVANKPKLLLLSDSEEKGQEQQQISTCFTGLMQCLR